MRELLAEISRHHFPNPPATPAEIEAFEQRVGWRLDPDLRAFYLHCDGAELFRKPDSPFRIRPLSKIIRARVAIRGLDDDSRGPASWYALCALHDSNYVLLDVGTQEDGRYPILDGYREAFPNPHECKRIAGSFSEFLTGALRSHGRWFWLADDAPE
ncbi:SMI1/KNR4 family protein [Pyxidicoccus fallax]|uniref:SMI1/KNR4 family protein n=1 Tax=Pyxidicoccus fallax TaxID=394095 RepID=A0A848LZX7_9BACT|nr:SMI1/KNR4 family protein [Pyxidicoccus fallax]NMO22694.1 SMI1/KNR4 family protein [Pyxidicoccus fallax]NPC85256.1 SMI1/KNR4 family protein [Pyxidicoccus fallax]